MNPGSAAREHSLRCELACDALRVFGNLQLKAEGWSMLPGVWPGDTILISATHFSDIAPGEIGMFRRGDRFFAHRVLYRDDFKKEILAQGDAMPQADPPFTHGELLGKVAFIVRNGQWMEPSRKLSLPRRAFAALVRRSTLAARIAVRARHWYQNRGSMESNDRARLTHTNR